MKPVILASILLAIAWNCAAALPERGTASWYGEPHRGRLMANGQKFDPDKFTAASWFYPLGTKVSVTVRSPQAEARRITVTITDRGPAWRLVRRHRIIDLSHAAFKELAEPDLGLIKVKVERVATKEGSADRRQSET